MQSTSSQENFEEKLLFFENYYNLWNIFWIQSNIFSDSCLKTFNRFVETAFHVSRRNFQNLLGKVFDCFVVFGSRTKISVISDFWTNHFGNVVKRPSRVHRKRSGKNVFFFRRIYILSSIFLERKFMGLWAETTAWLSDFNYIWSADPLEKITFSRNCKFLIDFSQ